MQSRRITTLIGSKPILFLSSVYVLICFFVLAKTGGLGDVNYITDFVHYHSFWHRYVPLDLSERSQELFKASVVVDPSVRASWMPNPFYSIIALFPLTLLGSVALINVIGIISGLIQLSLFYSIARGIFNLSVSYASISSLLCIANKWFIKESIGLTTMSLATLFATLALTRRRPLCGSVFHILAFMVRPNYCFFYIPYFILQFFGGPKDFLRRKIIFGLLPLLVAAPWMLLIDSSYPGSALGYLFVSKWMGFDFASDYFPAYLSSMGFDAVSILSWNASLIDICRALFDAQALNFMFSLWSLKLLSVLGYRFEEMFVTNMGGYFSELWGTLYAFLVSVPAFFAGLLSVLRIPFFRLELSGSLAVSSVLYLLFTSLLIGVPRYQLLVMPFLIPNLLGVVSSRVLCVPDRR